MKAPANNTLKEKTIWELLNTDLVTYESIRTLLRKHKPPPAGKSKKNVGVKGKAARPQRDKARIVVSAKNKQVLIDRNLRIAVENQLIPIESVYDLLRDGEENGAQRIFFFRPRTKKAATGCSAGGRICNALYGSDDLKSLRFPRLLEGWAAEPAVADFRQADGTWTAKWHWRSVRKLTLGEDLPDGADTDGIPILKKTYQKIEERAVMVARWNSHCLELRVPNAINRQWVEQMVNRLWALLGPALQKGDFEEWNLEPINTKIIKEAKKWAETYEFGDTIVRSTAAGQTTSFNTRPPEPTEDDHGQYRITFAPEQKIALGIILEDNDNQSERLVVHWKKAKETSQPNQKNANPLRVVLAAEERNEISIGAKTTGKAIDYVIYRLREFES